MVRKKADPVTEKARAEQDENKRAFRYSPDCPEGKIFKGADAIAAADKDGWVDKPGDVKAPKADSKAK